MCIGVKTCILAARCGFGRLFNYTADTARPKQNTYRRGGRSRQNISATAVVTAFSPSKYGVYHKLVSKSITLPDGRKITAPIGIRLLSDKKYSCGDVLDINARIYTHDPKFNPSDFNKNLYLKTRGCEYSFYCTDTERSTVTVRDNIKTPTYILTDITYAVRAKMSGVYEKLFDPRRAGLLKAVILGDKSGVDDDITDSFRNAGIYHFLAVSGLHLSVIALFILYSIGRADKRLGYIAAVLFLALFRIMTGAGVSVTRAFIMFCIFSFGKLTHRKYDLTSSASAAAIFLLCSQPLFLFDTGFLYSFGAVFGIALVMEPVGKVNIENRLLRWLLYSSAAAFGATLFTRVITLGYFYTLDPLEIPVNMLLIPVMSLTVVYAFAVGMTGLVSVGAAKVLSLLLGPLLDLMIFASDKLGFSCMTVGRPDRVTMSFIIIAALLFVPLMHRPNIKRLVPLLVVLPMILISAVMPKNCVSINFLYVGQGDSCVICDKDEAYIIDCGGNPLSDIGSDTGKYKIMPFLNYSGIKKVKAVFISHSDSDHIKGLFDMMGNADIENIYVSRYVEKNENFDKLTELADKNAIGINYLDAGQRLDFNGLCFDVLYPESRVKDNDSSLVLKFTHGKNSVLFTGDITKRAEKQLLDADIDADVLKLAHHGSKTSSDKAFVSAVSPNIAVVSAGLNNQFSHPAEETVKRLGEMHIPLYATYDGMISFKSDKNTLKLQRWQADRALP